MDLVVGLRKPNMDSQVNYTIVGTFVILLLTAIALGIIWLSSGFSFKTYSTYMIYMQESVSGLNVDSVVEFNGVQVGKVIDIKLNKENPQLVEVLAHVQQNIPITQGTVATLTTRGLTGVMFIALKDKGLDHRPLKKLAGQSYPIIKTSPSIFVRIDSVLTEFALDFRQIASSIHDLLDKENLMSIKLTLKNLEQITGTLAFNKARVEAILRNTERGSQQFPILMHSGISAAHAIEADTLPSVSRLMNNLDEVSNRLNEISLEIKQNPAILIRGSESDNLGPGETK